MVRISLLFVAAAAIVAAGCGGEPAPVAVEESAAHEADVCLVVEDSLGVEFGDSNYVFGTIADVALTPEGLIAVLDMQQHSIKLFSTEGEFVREIGRKGNGPGEFLLPAGMAFFAPPEEELPDSLVPWCVISDPMGGRLVYFNGNMEFMMEVQGFFPSPPVVIEGVRGGHTVGMKPDFKQDDSGMYMGFTVARWPMGEVEPSVVYYDKMSPFDPSDISTLMENVVVFGASSDGMVLTAPMSDESYEFTLWSPDGEEIFTFRDDDFKRVPKTPEEIEEERDLVSMKMRQNGMPESMAATWEPDPYKYALTNLQFDGADRIWVTRGTSETPTFDVFSLEGELLFTADLGAGERARLWQVVIDGNMFLAFDADPEDYPRVYLGELPGF